MRLLALRVVAVLFALGWLVFPGFGLIDLAVTWDPDRPVVLEAGWGVFMTVLVGGSFLAVAVLLVEAAAVVALLPRREPVRPMRLASSWPLLALAAAGAVPWLINALHMVEGNRDNLGVLIGDVTNRVDHYAVQGALALIVLSLLAALWPRGRRQLGASAALCATYLGLVSCAFPGTAAGLGPVWSVLCLTWGLAVGLVVGSPGGTGAPVRGGRVPR